MRVGGTNAQNKCGTRARAEALIALQETTLLLEHFDLHFSTLLPTRVEGLSFRARSPKFIPSPKSLCRSIHQQPPLDASKYGDRLKSGGAVVCLNAISCCALVNFIMWGFGGRRRAVVEEQETRARPAAAAVPHMVPRTHL